MYIVSALRTSEDSDGHLDANVLNKNSSVYILSEKLFCILSIAEMKCNFAEFM